MENPGDLSQNDQFCEKRKGGWQLNNWSLKDVGLVVMVAAIAVTISAGLIYGVIRFSSFQNSQAESHFGGREYGRSPEIHDFWEAGQDVGLIEVKPVKRYAFRTQSGSIYECDTLSNKCHLVRIDSEYQGLEK